MGVILIGGIDAAFSSSGASDLGGLGWSALLFSVVGIVGSIVVRSKAKLGGALMTISAIAGVISVSMFYVIPGILLIIGGLMGLLRKDKTKSIEA
ncbi:hypothetical protein D3C84_1062640 [compost metagenome]